jgi:anti-sigma factor RsiW
MLMSELPKKSSELPQESSRSSTPGPASPTSSPLTTPMSLSCESCREFLSDYIDRELTEEERRSVERHLATCTQCGSESHRLLGLKNVVQHWGGVPGSGEFRQAVVQQMIRESQQMPSAAFVQQAAAESSRMAATPESLKERMDSTVNMDASERDDELKTLPPVWVFLVAVALAVVAYCVVIKLRGV